MSYWIDLKNTLINMEMVESVFRSDGKIIVELPSEAIVLTYEDQGDLDRAWEQLRTMMKSKVRFGPDQIQSVPKQSSD